MGDVHRAERAISSTVNALFSAETCSQRPKPIQVKTTKKNHIRDSPKAHQIYWMQLWSGFPLFCVSIDSIFFCYYSSLSLSLSVTIRIGYLELFET